MPWMRRLPRKRRLLIGGILALLGLALAACPRERSAVPAVPRRLISLAPNVTEILFALGLGERVVGVGTYTFWPPAALAKPRVGGLIDPNLERIATLHPDLAVLLPSEKDVATKLAALGVESLVVHDESLAEVEASIRTIAERCGVPEAGSRLVARLRNGLRPRELPAGTPRPRVLLVVERTAGRLGELYAVGPGTFLDELLRRLGGENVFADAGSLYPPASLEEIVARRPDVIVELRSTVPTPAEERALLADWRPLAAVPAVSQNRVRIVAGSFALVPGPRLPELYRALAAALAPASPALLPARREAPPPAAANP